MHQINLNYLVLNNNPLDTTENITISVADTVTLLTNDDFEIIDEYKGIIEITNADFQDNSSFYVSYEYL